MWGGRDTSLKSCIYPKMLELLVFVLETFIFACRLLFGQGEEPEPYFHEFDPTCAVGGHATSIYLKLLQLIFFVLESFYACRLLFGQDEGLAPYFHEFEPISGVGGHATLLKSPKC